MKTRNTAFSVFLSLILFVFIFISAVFFVTLRIFEKGSFDQILSVPGVVMSLFKRKAS